jgi:hypothetical protein
MEKDKDHGNPRFLRYGLEREAAIALLGGRCVKCGTTENLEIDHIDPKKKSFTLAGNMHTKPVAAVKRELRKCQLLCETCHMVKTIAERGHKPAKGTHGTLSSYRYCKCELCTAAHSKYCLEWKARKADAKRKRQERRDGKT